ncbi:MAG TPA: ribonuclease Z [Armatimonadaceae bacterium]|nr:ribonuclease Z [Armatimonadaceae bacterium]
MLITFLGTGSGAPSRARNVSATALHLPERGEMFLIDCGEGTQHQVLRAAHVRLSQLTRVFITHLHGDHVFGLVGLLASRSLAQGGTSPVTLYGPAALEAYVRGVLATTGTQLGYPVHFHAARPGLIYEDGQVIVRCAPVRHRCEAYAYAVEEKPQAGRFDVERARALGIPEGPIYGRLKAGETVTLPDDGRVIDGNSLVGPPRPGRKVAFSGDTLFTPEMVELARGADLLVHESTYSEADRPLADRAAHSTSAGAAQVARRAGVQRLVLTHFSPRYDAEPGGIDGLLDEARAVFPNTDLAHDFLRVEVPRRAATPTGDESPAAEASLAAG